MFPIRSSLVAKSLDAILGGILAALFLATLLRLAAEAAQGAIAGVLDRADGGCGHFEAVRFTLRRCEAFLTGLMETL
jgi:hypothetical protein